ncbi:hypothetical protein MMC30_001331 [Trapelia coarctata]|nr:hypothetical protein [Trapelia coarctata]
MAWRNQGITGSNNIPLGSRRRFGAGDSTPPVDDGGYNPTQPSTGLSDGYKRGRSPDRHSAEPAEAGERRRKKRNRWGDASENKAAGLMGLPTMIKANMTNEQLEAYTLHLRIQEISEKLRIDDVVPADGDRSPSPPPQYDNFGRRVNTREYRYRKRLEDERHRQIEKAMKIIPNYHPPSDYRRPTKTQEKVYVPVNDYPEINFIGLLIGPRGNTLKKMETESQAKIAIRGKGSVKEGKGRSDAAHTSNQEEDLHCLIMADTEEKVNKAKKLIHQVIETAASIPEGQNELKRNQLRELAALNGTLRDDENQACQNCGQIGHRKYDCPEQRNFTANIICRVCGNAGHMARDCPDRQRGANWRNDAPGAMPGRAPAGRIGGGGDAVDREYENSRVVHPPGMAKLPSVSKLVLEAMTTLTMMAMVMVTATSNLGNVDPLAQQLPGNVLEAIMVEVEITVLRMAVQLHPGPPLEVVAEKATDTVNRTMVLLLARLAVLLRGTNKAYLLPLLLAVFLATMDIRAIQAMAVLLAVILLNQAWVLHQGLVVVLAVSVLLPDLVLFSRLTTEMESRAAHLHHPRLEMHPHLR